MHDNVSIKEELIVVVRDIESGKIIRRQKVYPRWYHKLPRSLLSILQRLPFVPHLTNSVSSYGLNHAANFWGNTGTPLSIDQIGAFRVSWNWRSANISGPGVEGDGICKIDNEGATWSVSGAYTSIRCRNSGDAFWHNDIVFGVTIAVGQEWWCEVVFTFS